ncbi:MAG TPA: MFS transporter [Candidatus Dormibacteraeota bacterium]|nr:MFS transporter [Candidatus Dormibacteraeota bacterium]
MKRSGYAALLRNRDFRLLLSGLTVSAVGSWTYNVALAVFVFDSTHSPALVGVTSLTRFLSQLLGSTYAGVIAERFERVRLLVLSDLSAMTLMALLAVVAALHGPVALAVILSALTAVTVSIYSPAVKATTPGIVGEEQLAAANGLESTVDNLAVVAGPAIGALILLLGPPSVAFAVNAATFAYSAFIVSRLRTRTVSSDVSEGGRAGPLRQMWAGVTAITSSPTITLLVAFSVLASFVYGTDTVLFVVVSRDLLGTGSTGYGYLLTGLGAGGVLMALTMNRVAALPRLGSVIVIGLAAYCLPTALLVVVHAPAAAFVLQVVRGAGTLVVDVVAMTALQRLVAPQLVSRVFGVFFALVLGAVAVGAIVAPLLLALLGLNLTLLVMAFAIPLLVAALWPMVRTLDSAGLTQLTQLAPRIALLQKLDIFTGASRAVLERLAQASVEQQAAAGTVLIREGDVADYFYVLADGVVTVSSKGRARTQRELGELRAPGYFGEIGLFEAIPRTATVTVREPATLYRIGGDDFLNAMTMSPPSPGAIEAAKLRLGRTHPARTLSMAGLATQ